MFKIQKDDFAHVIEQRKVDLKGAKGGLFRQRFQYFHPKYNSERQNIKSPSEVALVTRHNAHMHGYQDVSVNHMCADFQSKGVRIDADGLIVNTAKVLITFSAPVGKAALGGLTRKFFIH